MHGPILIPLLKISLFIVDTVLKMRPHPAVHPQ